MNSPQPLDAIIVGAGFSGLYMLHRLRQSGFSAQILEAAPNVGGTWFWNRYPGARCDIESYQYSYQFDEALQQDWVWRERYAAQPDILAYIEHVADRYDLRRDITFNTRVSSATFDESTNLWTVETDSGETRRSRYFIMAVGCLSSAIAPKFPGQDAFGGPVHHTGHWPQGMVEFAGKRIGVVGTGSSAIQAIPIIAETAEHLHVFQRTANYVVPAQNKPLGADEIAALKADYKGFRARAKQRPSAFLFPFHTDSCIAASPAERRARFEEQWKVGGLPFLGAYADLLTDPEANRLITEFWKDKIREVVADPAVAALLTPKGEIFGCKRLCSGTNYYETFNRPNVSLVDVGGDRGIERFVPDGLVAGGRSYPLDMIVLATGFDAMTGSIVRIDIRGVGGRTIQEAWREGPGNYLGVAVAGFPNMFNLVGVGGPSVLATMVTCSEQNGDWVADLMTAARAAGRKRIEAKPTAQAEWGHIVEHAADGSLRSSCNSWYVGSNVAGKARVFMPYIGGFPSYVAYCAKEVAAGYPGFEMR